MKYNAKNGSWKFDEYSYSVDKKIFKKAHRKNGGYKSEIITIIIFISILIFIFYPFDLEGTAGIKNLTADHISSIYLNQHIITPKDMDIKAEEITMNDIGNKLEELKSLPLSEYSERHILSGEDITDKDFIEEVLSVLSNHNMRKRRFGKGCDTFPADYTMPSSTRVSIHLNDSHETRVHISISHDPRYVNIYKTNNINGRMERERYKIYGDGIDTQKNFTLIRKF